MSNPNQNHQQTDQEMILPTQLFERPPIKHYTQTIPVNIHHFYLTGEIEDDIERYIELLNVLKTSEPHDTIFIYINSIGGNLTTTVQIINSIKQSQAHVITSLEGEACSAATMVFLSGDKQIVNENCSFMIHNYSHTSMGKGNEVMLRVEFVDKYFKKLAQNLYQGFLTEEEISSVCEGKDMWMDSEEVAHRLGLKKDEAGIYSIPEEEIEEEIEESETPL